VIVRVACVWVPEFPVQALRRSAPDLAEAPLVIAAGPSPRDVLVAVAAEAAALGVRPGMTAAQARQVAPAVMVRVTPAAAAEAADEALADVAGGFSPRLERHLPGEVVLDVGGLVPRFGSERRIAHELLRACRRIGLEARAGVASSVGVARVAARCAGSLPGADCASGNSLPASAGGTGGHEAAEVVREAAGPPATGGSGLAPARRGDAVVVRGGDERAFMAPLPLALLEPPPEAAVMLARWGLATAGELARLARREVGLRLGPAGLTLHRLACGEEAGAFVPDPICELLREGVELDDPLGALEPFLFVTSGILARLAQRLELRGEGFAGVLLELRLEGAGRREVPLALVAPTRDVPAVLALARLQLEAHPPGAPVEGVTALVTPGRVRLAQGSLFGAPMPAPGKLSTTLARLAALVGPERVGAPAVPDTHRPGAFGVRPFALSADRGSWSVVSGPQDGASGRQGKRSTDHGPLTTASPVLRAFRPPREARVDAVDGRPVVVWVEAIGGIVVSWAGPYRFAGDWWGGERFARDDFDVATTDGSLLRVHFDRLARRWFADGVYD
jgi:protein ImuB